MARVATRANESPSGTRNEDALLAPDELKIVVKRRRALRSTDEFVVHVATKRSLALAATEGANERRTMLFRQWHGSITSMADRQGLARVSGLMRS